MSKVLELTNKLIEASKAYYTGNPIMSDAEFDTELERLKTLEKETGISYEFSPTRRVGYEVDSIDVLKLDHPMLSLDKVHTIDEIKKFANGKRIVVTEKLDGNSMTARYENGVLVSLCSRGNGESGNNLMHHAHNIKWLPYLIPHSGTYVIDGECIITNDDFAEINKDKKFANSRNCVSGTLNSLDGNLSKERRLAFVAWNVIKNDKYGTGEDLNSKFLRQRLSDAEALGFEIVPCSAISVDEIEDTIAEFKHSHRGYPIDGAVVSFNDMEYGMSLDRTSKFFRHSVAYKYEDEVAVTKLVNIELSCGKNKLTPVAVFEPVELDGTIVERASLHNATIMKGFEFGIGDEIEVFKSNMIIPQVRENLTRSNTFVAQTTCPDCGAPIEIVKLNATEEFVCSNEQCPSKLLRRLSHFVSRDAMNIDGLSEQTLEKFVELGWVLDYKDIYSLKDHYIQAINLDGFGKKSIDKLLDAIEKSRTTTLSRFLYSLSIPLIGRTACKAIEEYVAKNTDGTFGAFIDISDKSYIWSTIEGFGTKMCDSMRSYFRENKDMVVELAELMTFETKTTKVGNSLEGLTFVVTGSVEVFKNRKELQVKIEELGGKVVGSVSANTSYLINNDVESSSSKNKKAKSLGIPIISEQDFISKILS